MLDPDSGPDDGAAPEETHRGCRGNEQVVFWLAAGILLAGLAIRGLQIDKFFLNCDESFHFQLAKEADLGAVYRASLQHSHPPLIFAFYHYWIKLGQAEWFLRLPSCLFGGASLWLAFLWLRQAINGRAALVGMAFLAFCVPTIFLAREMRSYGLLLCWLFAALYFWERAFRSRQVKPVVLFTVFLTLAVLTHYSTVLFAFVLGIATLYRILAEAMPRRWVLAWSSGQILVFGVCLLLYFTHVKRFAGTPLKDMMWQFQTAPFRQGGEAVSTVRLLVWKTLEFFGAIGGSWAWLVFLAMPLAGTFLLMRQSRQRGESLAAAGRWALLILLPFLTAWGALAARIYPLNGGRYSVWLYPFLTLAVAGTCTALVKPGRRWTPLVVALALGIWAYNEVSLRVAGTHPPLSRSAMQQIAAAIREHVPAEESLIVDLHTRNILDYYLGGLSVNRSFRSPDAYRDYTGKFEEYTLGGFHVISTPDHFLANADLRRAWPRLEESLSRPPRKHAWLVSLDVGTGTHIPAQLQRRLPPTRDMRAWNIAGNYLVRIELADSATANRANE